MNYLWAPWRMSYVTHEKKPDDACFLCRGWAEADHAARNLLVARGKAGGVMLNRFPYNAGHLMVAPGRHVATLDALTEEEAADLFRLVCAAQSVMTELMNPEGFNVGVNQGAAAGAGHAAHLHIHVVPRWAGDHNFMTVCADVRVVPEALDATYTRMAPLFAARGFGVDANTPPAS